MTGAICLHELHVAITGGARGGSAPRPVSASAGTVHA
jgi:hypothetical protein